MSDGNAMMRSCHSCGAQVPSNNTFCGRCGSRWTQDSEAQIDHLIGQVVEGRFRIEARVATGGMGSVYRAEHVGIGKQVAIKFLRADLRGHESLVQRLRREAMAVSKLGDVHTISVFDFGVWQGLVYLVMEYLHGEDLAAILSRDKRLPPLRVLRICRQVCSSLAEAHGVGVIHRDLKPENIFLTYSTSGEEVVKVLDFGLAKLLGATDAYEGNFETQDGALLGTPYYMAPEQVNGGPIGARTDLYALGALMYRMLTGVLPFTGRNPLEVFTAQRNQELTPVEEAIHGVVLPKELSTLVHSLLAYKAEDRPASAISVANEMRQIEVILGGSEDMSSEMPIHGVTAEHDRVTHIGLMTPPSDSKDASKNLASSEQEPHPSLSALNVSSEEWFLSSTHDVVNNDNQGLSFAVETGLHGHELGLEQNLGHHGSDAFTRRFRRRRLLRIWLTMTLILALSAGAVWYFRFYVPPTALQEIEPNDDVKRANILQIGHTIRGFIGKRADRKMSDQDVFRLQLPAGQVHLSIDVTGVPGLDLVVDVFTYDGLPLDKGNQAGKGEGERLEITVIQPRGIHVRVREVWVEGNSPRENSTDPYSLTVTARTEDSQSTAGQQSEPEGQAPSKVPPQ